MAQLDIFNGIFSRYQWGGMGQFPIPNPYKSRFVLSDSFVQAAINERVAELRKGVWKVTPVSPKDKKAAEFLRSFLNGAVFSNLESRLLQGVVTGLWIDELCWDKSQNELIIKDSSPLCPSMIDFRLANSKSASNTFNFKNYDFLANTYEGILEINPFKLAIFSYNSTPEYPIGAGLIDQLYFLAILNPESLKSAANWVKRFAHPVPVGSYTVEAGTVDLFEALKAYEQGKFFGIPEGTAITLLEAKNAQGSKNFYEWLLGFCKKTVRSLILGESYGEDANQGLSGKPAESDSESKQTQAESDAKDILHHLKGVLTFLIQYNFDCELPLIEIEFPANQTALSERSKRDRTLFDMGFTLKPEAVARIYGDDYNFDGGETNFSQTPTNSLDFRAVIDRIIKWNGLELGIEYLPGQVRFPGTNHAKKLQSGYGHIRNYRNTDGEALDCYVHPSMLVGEDTQSPIFIVSQFNDKDEFDEYKVMIGWENIDDAETAYLAEMPIKYLGGIEEVFIEDLEQFKKGAKVDFIPVEDDADIQFALRLSEIMEFNFNEITYIA
ncbi:DUF935 family protein [Kamptonema sp. UHCC 0994]|uniref:phage portal protein family protein n=1 Tax=Kamptonema sp. UHCC 0994 TaxID=3031329 RepID=UPI0023B97587|nr:DUF935 family protein [Kamptonema sp. UHCC 0994]MDF0554927.1 DUF935 family protein [Kamptonema sp. UHCC 0994]